MPKQSKIRPEDVASIARRLKALRISTGLSQEAFAAKVGLGYKQWGNFEAATGRIGLDAALVLQRELKVPLDWIYLGEEAWLPSGLRDKIREASAEVDSAPQSRRVSRAS